MADSSTIKEALKYHFGFESFKGNQLPIIQSLLDGNDVFVLMPTGGGKSLCYQLPALMMEGTAIVISPLIALMKNQVDAMRHYEEDDGVAHFLNSSLNKVAINKVKRDVRSGRTKLLYVAPESLTKEENIEFLQSVNISFFAIDEAHCISEWGHDFRPEYRRIRPIIDKIGSRPVIALTATATPKVQHDIQYNLNIPGAYIYKSSFNRPNLFYEVRPKTRDVEKDVIKYIKAHPGESGIVYCLSRKKVEDLSEILRVNGISCLPYHAGMDVVHRAANQDAFLEEKIDIIVATIAFGMGIDKPDVRFVIHYDVSKSLEGYYQETGRAGRDGGRGHCIAYYSVKDLQKLYKLMQTKPNGDVEINRQLLQETSNYSESSVCRRKILLRYFGEEYTEDNCGMCDNCTTPRKRVDATDDLITLLEAIEETGEKYKEDYIFNILIGRKTDEIARNGDQNINTFGALSGHDERYVLSLLRQAVFAGYICRDTGAYGVLKISEKGGRNIVFPEKFELIEDIDYSSIDTEDNAARSMGSEASDPQLFALLKSLRRDMARKHNLPPYVIFQDPSLEAMATLYPTSREELLNIPGVGAGKAARYGREFCELIKKYVDENEIERPQDIRVRVLPKGSILKIGIIQAIDRKIALPEIAVSKGISMEELLAEVERIVEGGTRINIDYYIDEIIDEDLQEDIFDYFRESEDGNLDDAFQEWGDELDEEQIRLMRVKFMAEMGN